MDIQMTQSRFLHPKWGHFNKSINNPYINDVNLFLFFFFYIRMFLIVLFWCMKLII